MERTSLNIVNKSTGITWTRYQETSDPQITNPDNYVIKTLKDLPKMKYQLIGHFSSPKPGGTYVRLESSQHSLRLRDSLSELAADYNYEAPDIPSLEIEVLGVVQPKPEIQTVTFLQPTLSKTVFDDWEKNKKSGSILCFTPSECLSYVQNVLVTDATGNELVFTGVVLGFFRAVPFNPDDLRQHLRLELSYQYRELHTTLLRKAYMALEYLNKLEIDEVQTKQYLKAINEIIDGYPLTDEQYESNQHVFEVLLALRLTGRTSWIADYGHLAEFNRANNRFIQYLINWMTANCIGASRIRTVEVAKTINNEELRLAFSKIAPEYVHPPLSWVSTQLASIQALKDRLRSMDDQYVNYLLNEIEYMKQLEAVKLPRHTRITDVKQLEEGKPPINTSEHPLPVFAGNPDPTQDIAITALRQETIRQLIHRPWVNVTQAEAISHLRLRARNPRLFKIITVEMRELVVRQLETVHARMITHMGQTSEELDFLNKLPMATYGDTKVVEMPFPNEITHRSVYQVVRHVDTGQGDGNDCFFCALGIMPRPWAAWQAANLLGTTFEILRRYHYDACTVGRMVTFAPVYLEYIRQTHEQPLGMTPLGIQDAFNLPPDEGPWGDIGPLSWVMLITAALERNVLVYFSVEGPSGTFLPRLPLHAYSGTPGIPPELSGVALIRQNGSEEDPGNHFTQLLEAGDWFRLIEEANYMGEGPFSGRAKS
ncbi:MAG: hypothetical protein LBF65_01510 [Holosporales bacterium]|nr:hypothetical protein [Holosporales bacterium]